MQTEQVEAGPPLPRPPADGDINERLAMWHQYAVDVLRARPAIRSGLILALSATLGIAGWILISSRQDQVSLEDALPVLAPTEVSQPPVVSEPDSASVVVHVAGAVTEPGLVEVAKDARVADAVAAAGGALAIADLDRVNLASRVADGDRIAIPAVGEDAPALLEPAANDGGEVGRIDLNRGTAAELETLPGVGPATAAAIIAFREANGNFGSVTALDQVPGIGPAKLDQLRALVSVDP